VLLLARSARMAARLARAFQARTTRKIYWAAVAGAPAPRAGTVRLGLVKAPGQGHSGEGERMVCVPPDQIAATEGARRATSDYVVIETAGRRVAWVVLSPVTGRTHQLRAHMEAIGHPILGDGKYDGRVSAFAREPIGGGISRKLHLHARSLGIAHPGTGEWLAFTAPLPEHMARTWALFGWRSEDAAGDPFEAVA
jgi:23S rRNA pseudouridine955/2504/2580 synthase